MILVWGYVCQLITNGIAYDGGSYALFWTSFISQRNSGATKPIESRTSLIGNQLQTFYSIHNCFQKQTALISKYLI